MVVSRRLDNPSCEVMKRARAPLYETWRDPRTDRARKMVESPLFFRGAAERPVFPENGESPGAALTETYGPCRRSLRGVDRAVRRWMRRQAPLNNSGLPVGDERREMPWMTFPTGR